MAGRAVQRYSQLRAEHGHLGILDSDSSNQVALGASILRGGLSTVTSVSAKANTVGAEHATEVSELFKPKLPEVDWEAARRAADAPPEDISSNNAPYLYVAVGVVVAVIAYIALS